MIFILIGAQTTETRVVILCQGSIGDYTEKFLLKNLGYWNACLLLEYLNILLEYIDLLEAFQLLSARTRIIMPDKIILSSLVLSSS